MDSLLKNCHLTREDCIQTYSTQQRGLIEVNIEGTQNHFWVLRKEGGQDLHS